MPREAPRRGLSWSHLEFEASRSRWLADVVIANQLLSQFDGLPVGWESVEQRPMRPVAQGLMSGALTEYFAAEGSLVEKNSYGQFASHDACPCACLETSVIKIEAGVCHIG